MSADVDRRLAEGVLDAAAQSCTDPDALSHIVERSSRTRPASHRVPVLIAAAALGAVVAVAAFGVVATRGSGPPMVAAEIRLPAVSNTSNCADIELRAATADEAALVEFAPDPVPAGYVQGVDGAGDGAETQLRPATSDGCWTSDVVFVDATGARLLAAQSVRQGQAGERGCAVPKVYRLVECVDVNGSPAALFDQGTRLVITWFDDDVLNSLAGFGFTVDELQEIAAETTVGSLGVDVPSPTGMVEFDRTPWTRTDDRAVAFSTASYESAGGGPGGTVDIVVSTWDDTLVNDVGPAETVAVGEATAIVVTTGGAQTGITGWTIADPATPRAATQTSTTERAYITWTAGGVTFRIDGPDAATVTSFARNLRALPN